MTNEELIARAASVLKPYTAKDRTIGDVGAAVWSAMGHVYTGVSIDTPGWGLCAERSAIAAMVTSGEYRIAMLAAVWKDEASGKMHVLPPCGICREFMRALDEGNLDAQVVLGRNKAVTLRALLPYSAWPEPLEG